MILMCVRQRNNIQFLKSARPQIRRHRFFARIDTVVLFTTGESAERSPAIDQQSFAARRHDKSESPWPTSRTVSSSLPLVHFSPNG